mmetsp:Transcript_49321/g.127216  ORF Transcript_49321/g.127216 Transcript_49321/m.127216 type:complete len:202 (-) Transcript_49321:317-922(-)
MVARARRPAQHHWMCQDRPGCHVHLVRRLRHADSILVVAKTIIDGEAAPRSRNLDVATSELASLGTAVLTSSPVLGCARRVSTLARDGRHAVHDTALHVAQTALDVHEGPFRELDQGGVGMGRTWIQGIEPPVGGAGIQAPEIGHELLLDEVADRHRDGHGNANEKAHGELRGPALTAAHGHEQQPEHAAGHDRGPHHGRE